MAPEIDDRMPFLGAIPIAKVSDALSLSTSMPTSVMDLAAFCEVVTTCGITTGASLTAETVTVTVAVLLSADPSLALKVRESEPLKLDLGV